METKTKLADLYHQLDISTAEMDKAVLHEDIQQKENEIVKKLLTVLRDEGLTVSQSISLLQCIKQEILEFRLNGFKHFGKSKIKD